MTSNIPMSSADILDYQGLLKRKPTQVEKIDFPRSQRKRRKAENQNRQRPNTKKKVQLFNRC